MVDRWFALLVLVKITLPIVVGLVIILYLMMLSLEILHVVYTFRDIMPSIEAYHRELEDALQELKVIIDKTTRVD